jgi:KaiC/GvpD/RAD55 family RecA-like ATPase
MNRARPVENARVGTGIPGLDDILHGGLAMRRLFLVEGPAGAGKTTMALQFLLAGHGAGEKSLYISLSETRDEIEEVARSHGLSQFRGVLSGIPVLAETIKKKPATKVRKARKHARRR